MTLFCKLKSKKGLHLQTTTKIFDEQIWGRTIRRTIFLKQSRNVQYHNAKNKPTYWKVRSSANSHRRSVSTTSNLTKHSMYKSDSSQEPNLKKLNVSLNMLRTIGNSEKVIFYANWHHKGTLTHRKYWKFDVQVYERSRAIFGSN